MLFLSAWSIIAPVASLVRFAATYRHATCDLNRFMSRDAGLDILPVEGPFERPSSAQDARILAPASNQHHPNR
jgi:hypothetical protein